MGRQAGQVRHDAQHVGDATKGLVGQLFVADREDAFGVAGQPPVAIHVARREPTDLLVQGLVTLRVVEVLAVGEGHPVERVDR